MKGCQINAIIIILKWSTTDGRELKISEYTSQRKNAQYFLRLFQLYIDMLILSWDLYFSLWMVGRKVWKPLPKATLFTHKISNYCSFIVHSYNVEILNRWEYQTTLYVSWETCMQVKKQQLELDMEQQPGSK